MTVLPVGWVEAAFDEISTAAEQRVPRSDDLIKYVDIGSIDRDTKRIVTPQAISGADAPTRARKVIRSGDVLVSMTRPNLNAVALVPDDLDGEVASTGFDVLRAKGVDPRWIYYAVRTNRFVQEMSELVQGALYPAVRSADVRGHRLPLPPLSEQRRITDKLDGLLARLDACRIRLDRVPGVLKRFRSAVLESATTGALTDTQSPRHAQGLRFGDDAMDVPTTWRAACLKDVIDPQRPLCYGVVQPGAEDPDGVPLIRVQDMDQYTVLAGGLRTITVAVDEEYRRARVRPGDVLVSVVGTIGRTAVVPEGLEANIARAIARVACRSSVSSAWVHIWLSSPKVQWWLLNSSREVARKTLNLSELSAIPLALPPQDEQADIVRRAQSLLTLADIIEAKYQAARSQVDRLASAVLAKAFRGELVPQDPNDEPAAVLLERLRAGQSKGERGDATQRRYGARLSSKAASLPAT